MNADSNPTADHPAQMLPRHRAGVRYYFVDFGLAMHVEHPRSVNKYVVGPCGKNRMVPEFSSSGPYDVFKADVYILGNLFREAFYKVRGCGPSCIASPLSLCLAVLKCGMAMSSHRYDDQS